MIQIILPWPPAVNNLYMNVGKRRIRTKRYDEWLAYATLMLRKQDPDRIGGPFNIDIRCSPPDRRRRDPGSGLLVPTRLHLPHPRPT